MGVDTFGERHGTGVSHNLLDHGLVYMGLCQHGDAGVPGTVWRLVISKLLHQGCEVTVVVVPVIKVLLIRRVEQIFTLETVPHRFAISHRNRYMVEISDVVVVYGLHNWGGAATKLRCDKQKKKHIISYCDQMGS